MSQEPNNFSVFARSIEVDAFVKLVSKNRPTSAENLRHNFFNQIPLKTPPLLLFSPSAALDVSFKSPPYKPTSAPKLRPRTATARRYTIIKKPTNIDFLNDPFSHHKKQMSAKNKDLNTVINHKSAEAILNLGARQDPLSFSGKMLKLCKQEKRIVPRRKKPLVSEITGKVNTQTKIKPSTFYNLKNTERSFAHILLVSQKNSTHKKPQNKSFELISSRKRLCRRGEKKVTKDQFTHCDLTQELIKIQ